MLSDDTMRLVEDHLWLANRMAGRATRGIPTLWKDDLRSAAYEGLIAAARCWVPDGGAPFDGYAARRIRGAILQERRDLITGRRPPKDLMAQAESGNPDEWEPTYTKDRRGHRSLDEPVMKDDSAVGRETTLEEITADGHPYTDPAEAYAHRHDAADDIAKIVRKLGEKERRLIGLYYYDRLTLAKIARMEGVSEAMIGQRLRTVRERMGRIGWRASLTG